MKSKRTMPPADERVLDGLIGAWVDENDLGVPRARAIKAIRRFVADGLVRITVDLASKPGHIGIRVELTPPPGVGRAP